MHVSLRIAVLRYAVSSPRICVHIFVVRVHSQQHIHDTARALPYTSSFMSVAEIVL
jgi:hypothetical protein